MGGRQFGSRAEGESQSEDTNGRLGKVGAAEKGQESEKEAMTAKETCGQVNVADQEKESCSAVQFSAILVDKAWVVKQKKWATYRDTVVM